MTSSEVELLRRRVAALERLLQHVSTQPSIGRPNREMTYRTIFNAVNDGIIVHDLETGVIVDANQSAFSSFGYGPDTLIGAHIDLISVNRPPFTMAEVRDYIGRAAAGAPQQFEWWCKHRQGREFFVEVDLKRTPIGEREYLLAVFRDISERKEQEQLKEDLLHAQSLALAELSAPLIPLTDQLMVMPLIGSIDSVRADVVVYALVTGVAAQHVTTVIVDITGVPVIDTHVANALVRAAATVKLLGTRMILTGIRPEIAQTLIGLGVDLSALSTYSTVQAGIAHALGAAAKSAMC